MCLQLISRVSYAITSYRSERQHRIANYFQSHYEHTGNIDDLNKAISFQQRAVDNTAASHGDLPNRLNSLGNSLLYRFEQVGTEEDLNNAIIAQKRAVDLTPDDHEDMPGWLSNLGTSYERRFQRFGEQNDIDEAVALQERAVRLFPGDYEHSAIVLNNLGNALQTRFGYTHDINDINKAIDALEKAVNLTPPNDESLSRWLQNLGTALQNRSGYDAEGGSDLDKAISIFMQAKELAQNKEHDLDLPGLLNNLGNALSSRFERTGTFTDLEEAVSVQREAVESSPEEYAELPTFLANLGNSLYTLYEVNGESKFIEEAIQLQQRAVKLVPSDHVDLPKWLSNLAISFQLRFQRTNDVNDINEAISAARRAIDMVPDEDPSLASHLMNLGNSLLCRYDSKKNISDLEEALSQLTRVQKLTPDSGHQGRGKRLNSLAVALNYRFEVTKDLHDAQEAISILREAIELTSDSHPYKPKWLSTLSYTFSKQYAVTNKLSDIEEAISQQRQAIDLTPDGHPERPIWQNNLGILYEELYKKTNHQNDLNSAIEAYSSAAQSSSHEPIARMEAARQWGVLCSSTSPSESLVAYSVAFKILPDVIWLGQTIKNRHIQAKSVSELSNEAAALALSLGETKRAVEWLEQGRCVVWGQIDTLRNPVDELRGKDAGLADAILRVSSQLDSASSRSTIVTSLINIDEKISLQEQVRNHLRLAEEWQSLLERARNIPGFEDFLKPMAYEQIQAKAPDIGMVVVINAHSSRCDALAISRKKDLRHIPLVKASHVQLKRLVDTLKEGLRIQGRHTRVEVKGQIAPIESILAELWSSVVKPILESLELITNDSPSSRLPRIWWCPTGPLAFLPIHAAGVYRNGTGNSVSDFVISSYIPAINALQTRQAAVKQNFSGMLAIGQPNTPGLAQIPNAGTEVKEVQEQFTLASLNVDVLIHEHATRTEVLSKMDTHSWIHLACHAVQHDTDPTASGFHLYDGRLELLEIIKKSLPSADFAFLSACETSTGDKDLPDEAVHLAAGMITAGYRSVIATMWSISDYNAPIVAKEVYNRLLNSSGGEPSLSSGDAAYALHEAIKRLQEVLKDSESERAFLTWVPYIHMGM